MAGNFIHALLLPLINRPSQLATLLMPAQQVAPPALWRWMVIWLAGSGAPACCCCMHNLIQPGWPDGMQGLQFRLWLACSGAATHAGGCHQLWASDTALAPHNNSLSYRKVVPACSARDVVRPEAAEAVALLSKLGCSAAMLTGDAAAAAHAVGVAVGLPPDHVHAQLLPEQKLSKVGVQAFRFCWVCGHVERGESGLCGAVHAQLLPEQKLSKVRGQPLAQHCNFWLLQAMCAHSCCMSQC